MSRQFHVAVGSIFTECNDFVSKPTELVDFERQQLCRGPRVLEIKEGTVGGILTGLSGGSVEVIPLLVASACPGGRLSAACYRWLKEALLEDLQRAMPVDGVLLALHGAAVAHGIDDLEGDLLVAVRELVGQNRFVVATLDLHAHVTAAMVTAADALVAWETYPHRDALPTGTRAAMLLLDALSRRIKPAMALAKVPLLVGGVLGHTEGSGPFADVMRFAKTHEGAGDVLSTSVFLVHPYLDVPEMGGGGLVITNDNPELAVSLAKEIAGEYWRRRADLEPPVYAPAEAIRLGLQTEGRPVLLVETADCCGGGAAGDSVAALRALLEHAVDAPAIVPVVDPHAAAACHQAGCGQQVVVELGHQVDPRWGRPIPLSGRVTCLSNGRFSYKGGIWQGQQADMGPSAILKVGQVEILVATYATYDWADEQFRSLGLDAIQAKFVVVKNPMNYRLGFRDMYQAAYILDTPGPTPATVARVAYENLRRPYFPLDRDIADLTPVVYRRSTACDL